MTLLWVMLHRLYGNLSVKAILKTKLIFILRSREEYDFIVEERN